MISINLGKLKRGDEERLAAQLKALSAAGLQEIQVEIKGKESRKFLNQLGSEYDRKRGSRQRMILRLLLGSVSGYALIILVLILWL